MGDEKLLTEEIVELASRFGRYGYRRITALLRHSGMNRESNRQAAQRQRARKRQAREGDRGPMVPKPGFAIDPKAGAITKPQQAYGKCESRA